MEVDETTKEYIGDWTEKVYGIRCDKFSMYCDWEPFGIMNWVQIPLRTIHNYERYFDEDEKAELQCIWWVVKVGKRHKNTFKEF